MVSLDEAIVVRLEKGGLRFEILVDPELAWKFREGKDVDMDELLASPEIYRDARKGERASSEELHKTFGTTDPYEVAKIILKKGELHLTTEQRRKMLEEKRLRIATLISQRSINPQTGAPHPVERILNAMEEAKIHIDIFKPEEEQINEVVKSIRRILPLKIETRKLEVRVPPHLVGKVYGKLKGFNIIREQYGNDGSLTVVMEVPAGVTDEVMKKLNDITKGEIDIRLVET